MTKTLIVAKFDKLLKLADFLENEVEPRWFDIDFWATPGWTEQKCGTTACAMGWATVCFPEEGLSIKNIDDHPIGEVVYEKDGNRLVDEYAAAAFFGLSHNEAIHIFVSYPVGEDTKAHVIERIRKFVADKKAQST